MKTKIMYLLGVMKIPVILENLGQDYESIITSVFRSASSDVCAKFYAKDMHSGMRATIEEEIKNKMLVNLEKQADGIELIAVLMKSIQLPRGLASSIEQKLQAEQDAMRMEFIIQQAKLEAERKIIEAKAERDAQKILAEGLTDEIIKLRSIEAFNKLSQSNNSKVIITDGETPLLINQNMPPFRQSAMDGYALHPEVSVFKKPNIAIVTTGNELVEAGQDLSYGKIYESNSKMLLSALYNLKYYDVTLYRVEDDYTKTVETLNEAIKDNNLVLITGGISVGDYDVEILEGHTENL